MEEIRFSPTRMESVQACRAELLLLCGAHELADTDGRCGPPNEAGRRKKRGGGERGSCNRGLKATRRNNSIVCKCRVVVLLQATRVMTTTRVVVLRRSSSLLLLALSSSSSSGVEGRNEEWRSGKYPEQVSGAVAKAAIKPGELPGANRCTLG